MDLMDEILIPSAAIGTILVVVLSIILGAYITDWWSRRKRKKASTRETG